MRGKYQEVVPRAEEEDNNTDSSPNLFSDSQWDDISSVIPIFSAEFIPWVCLSPPLPLNLLIAVAASPELLLFSDRLVQADEMQTDLSKMDKKITMDQQLLKIKIFCTGLIRILLLPLDQLCRNSRSFPIPDMIL